MLIGGTAFSTAGGIKIARLILIFQKIINYKENATTFNETKIIIIIIRIIINLLSFHQLLFNFEKELSLFTNQINGKKLQKNNDKLTMSMVPLDKHKFHIHSDKAFREALFVVVLFIFFTMITAICIYYLNTNTKNNNFIDVIFETASTVSNTGLSAGITTWIWILSLN